MLNIPFRSLYWRIAVGFIACIVGVLLVQGGVFLWLMKRAETFVGSTITGRIAEDIAGVLERDPDLDLAAYVRSAYPNPARSFYIMMTDGRVVFAGRLRPPERNIQTVRKYFGSAQGPLTSLPATWERSPYWSASIVRDGQVVGAVGLVPTNWIQTMGMTLLWVGIALLVLGTILSSLFIFGPVHRRLRDLETVALKLGAGDLSVRAPERGGHEVAALARAFNRMADDLSVRAAQLAAAERTRRLLLADVSHELMTPLTAMRGYQEKLANDPFVRASEERSRYLDVIGDETQRVEHIVGDLLDLSRLESAGESLSLEDVSVEGLFGRVAARHATDAAENCVDLSTVVEHGAEVVYGDRLRLEQALQNLTANALRHTPVGGSVELRAACDGDGIRITVKDTGVGIAAEHLPFIFDRFYKADASRNGKRAGSGLGLSIVKAIAERHGGTISVSSRESAGTTFTIHLPPLDSAAHVNPHTSSSTPTV